MEMRLKGMTKAAVAKELGIKDIGRLKVWMRKYKQQGEFGLVDTRGRRKQYVDQERYIKRLELENAVLKRRFWQPQVKHIQKVHLEVKRRH
ncbi:MULTISPECIES: helix-turn-helix domain-containing protein [Brevibacillus]|uniref:helix-turn-helix domain-containing protein n=1 Tax=Brevibacillus TaxID=55080 RepID=UPI00286CA33C|nr:helix-turn-helix domain-containing protein [Brevibacillus nitrificans]